MKMLGYIFSMFPQPYQVREDLKNGNNLVSEHSPHYYKGYRPPNSHKLTIMFGLWLIKEKTFKFPPQSGRGKLSNIKGILIE